MKVAITLVGTVVLLSNILASRAAKHVVVPELVHLSFVRCHWPPLHTHGSRTGRWAHRHCKCCGISTGQARVCGKARSVKKERKGVVAASGAGGQFPPQYVAVNRGGVPRVALWFSCGDRQNGTPQVPTLWLNRNPRSLPKLSAGTCAGTRTLPCSFEEEKLQENVGHFGGSRGAQPREAPLPRLPLGHDRKRLMLEQLQS